MSELLGFSSILLLGCFTLILACFRPQIYPILLIAFTIRISVMLFSYYIAPLPDSDGDSEMFEQLAWTWSQGDFLDVVSKFPGPDATFISWIIAFPYYLTDRSVLMAQSIGVFFGISTVFIGWIIAKNLFGNRDANKVGYLLALFPTLVLYSTYILRESYTVFFLMLAIYGVINWSKQGGFKNFLIAILGFTIATFFHGGMIIGGLVFLAIVFIKLLKRLILDLTRGKFKFNSFILFLFAFLLIGIFVSSKISVDKLGTFKKITDVEVIIDLIQVRHEKGVTFPEWTIPKDFIEILYKAPIRLIYFISSPYPWNFEKIFHAVGFIDGLIYLTFSILIWKNRRNIMTNPATRNILIILLSYLFIYSLFVGNYGAVVRHRSKFICLFIILVAKEIPRIVFKKKIFK